MIKRLHILQAAAVVLFVWVDSSLAQETAPEPDLRPKLTIARENDDPIQIIQNAADAEGAQFILGNPNCKDEVRVSTFLAPAPGFVEMLINDMRITSAVALVDKPTAEGGGSGGAANTPAENETIEMFGGSLELNDTRCPENVQRSTAADVTIEQGRSTTKGTLLNYDNATGKGDLSGPVALERTAEGDSPALSVTADDGLTFDGDEDVSTFRGNVQTTSEGRVSSADTLEYNEAAGVAILRGSPARSQEGDDVVEGSVIEYDIDSNDVVVSEKVKAVFEYDREN